MPDVVASVELDVASVDSDPVEYTVVSPTTEDSDVVASRFVDAAVLGLVIDISTEVKELVARLQAFPVTSVVVIVVPVTSQPTWVEHILVEVVLVEGVIEPSPPVAIVVIKMVLVVQSSTVLVEVQVVDSELLEVLESELVVEVFDCVADSEFGSFPSSSSSSSCSAASDTASKLFLNFFSSSSVSGVSLFNSEKAWFMRLHPPLIVFPGSTPFLMFVFAELIKHPTDPTRPASPPPEPQPLFEDPSSESPLLSLSLMWSSTRS